MTRHVLAWALLAMALALGHGQAAEPQAPPDAYPARHTDRMAVERGRTLYTLHGCAFCHGRDIRGGEGGPNLLRSQRVLRDKAGELIADVVLKGVPNTSMPAFALKQEEISDLAEFLHSFEVSGYDRSRQLPRSIVTGNAAAGRRYFKRQCASCHSPGGDLQGLASRYSEPRELQQRWLMPSEGSRTMAVVTLPDATVVTGTLTHIDEFMVSLELADGTQRSFQRRGDVPKVEIRDPLARHKELLTTYSDRNIHDLTAFLVTLR